MGLQWSGIGNPDFAAAYVRGTSMRLDVTIATHGSPEGIGLLRMTGPDGLIGDAR